MNKKITVELDWDTIDRISVSCMKSTLENLENDLINRTGDHGMAIFVKEQEYDIILIQKHIEAFKIVLKYYGERSE